MNQDTVSGLYDFAAREYSMSGRWPSPDPSGMAAVSTKDPQTWNRYAYVRNSALHAVDPYGLFLTCGDCGTGGGGGRGCGIGDSGDSGNGDNGGDGPVDAGRNRRHAADVCGGGFGGAIIDPGGCQDPSCVDGTTDTGNAGGTGVSNNGGEGQNNGNQGDNQGDNGGKTAQDLCPNGQCPTPPPNPPNNNPPDPGPPPVIPPSPPPPGTCTIPVMCGSAPQPPAPTPPDPPPPQQPQTGWCTAMENGGTTVSVIGGGLFLFGTGEDLTVVGLPAGLITQTSGGIAMAGGTIVAGLGFLGKAAGLCH